MLTYEISFDDGRGFAQCTTRKRKDAAIDVAWRFAYEALGYRGLRDRPIAYRFLNMLNNYHGQAKATYDLGDMGVIVITKEVVL